MTNLERFLLLVIASDSLLLSGVDCHPGGALELPKAARDSSTEDDGPKETFRSTLIEDLKSRILRKLHLPAPPSGNLSPFSIANDAIRLLQKDATPPRERENLIVHASNRDFNSSNCNETFCHKFLFNITSDLASVISVHAWFHKPQPTERLTLSVYSSNSSEEDPAIKLKEDTKKITSESGWVKFELPKMLSLEERGSHLVCAVEIEGTDVNTQGGHSPFLVLRKYKESLERKKRTVGGSSENCSCCTENYYVSIKDLGWHKWVIYPEGFNVKTCRGQCDENRSSFTINYQRIISTLYKVNRTLPKPKCSFWAPSCKPASYLPQRMMYRYDNGTVHDQVIQDMLIDSCRCL